jgi:thymidylate synthase (FAD)
MSTDKGFQGWGPKTCPSCHGKGKSVDLDIVLTTVYPCLKCGGIGHVPGDEKLLAYLWTHKHLTPFEMAGATFEIQAPIFVFREWHRHRTQSYNELSARYTPLPDLNYVPTEERFFLNAGGNKQAQAYSMIDLSKSDVSSWLKELQGVYEAAQKVYEKGLKLGVKKELARLPVPVGRYSRMRASANLRNWLAFLTLRMDSAAQWEIRQYANAVHALLTPLFPRTLELFND